MSAARTGAPNSHIARRQRFIDGSPARATATPRPPPPARTFGPRRSPPWRPVRRRVRLRPGARAPATRPGGCAGPGCGVPRRPPADRQRRPPIPARALRTLPPGLRGMPGRLRADDRRRGGSWGFLHALCGQPRATLRAPACEDRSPPAGAHPDAEPVPLVTATVVRLEGSFRHRARSVWNPGATGSTRWSMGEYTRTGPDTFPTGPDTFPDTRHGVSRGPLRDRLEESVTRASDGRACGKTSVL